MVATIKTSLSIPKALCNQAGVLAQYLKISRNHLFRIAIEDFISNYPGQTLLDEMNKADQHQPGPNEQSQSAYPDATPTVQTAEERLVNRGDIYWVQLEDLSGSAPAAPGIRHPHVVIQDNVFNHSRINTVVTCALTSNMKRANAPGNVLLDAGEANLPQQSVAEVSKVSTVDKTQLSEYIGALTEQRINQILAGMRFLQMSFYDR